MKQTKRFSYGRLTLLVLALVLAATALTSCVRSTPLSTLPPAENVIRESDLTEGCQLNSVTLDQLAQLLVATYSNDFDTQEMMVAAYRGYNMLEKGFEDPASAPALTPDVNAALAILDKANETVKDEELQVDRTAYEALSAEDMLVLIRSMQTTVSTENDGKALDTLLRWIGAALGWMTNVLGGGYYIIGICIFAIVVEILMLPLAIKQQKNSIKQAKLRPKEMAIRKKYAGRDDQVTRQKVAQEIQELYQRENFNAGAGCLPLLIQVPIIMALYSIVIDPLHYVLGQASTISNALNLYFTTSRAAGGLGFVSANAQGGRGTIQILSVIGDKLDGLKNFLLLGNGAEIGDLVVASGVNDLKFNLGSVDLGAVPSLDTPSILWLVPVLTFVVYFFSMRLTKKFTYQPTNTMAGDDRQVACSNWMMDITMPLMSVWIAFVVPALVGVYWIFKSIISTLRQFIVTRVMPYPTFTEEDYRAAEREYAGKAPSKNAPRTYSYGKETTMVGGKPKSLFHMDDDDYVAKIEAQEKEEQQEKESQAKAKGVDGAALKSDDRADRADKAQKDENGAD